jgi:uncharacterized peroxidase-related enzyme
MTFIHTTAPADAEGEVRAMYDRQQSKFGYVPNYATVFCHRPELMASWAGLLAGIRRCVDPRRFELVTLAVALALRNSYCSLAHGKALAKLSTRELVCAIASDDADVLSPLERAIVSYARKVASDAASVSEADIALLREQGLTEAEIFDIAATAAARAFFAKLLDALGVQADIVFGELDDDLQVALVVGRPVSLAPSVRR